MLAAARLTDADAAAVHEEIGAHVAEFLEERSRTAAGDGPARSDEEVHAMIEEEFGSAHEIGRGIARGKGRLRTWLRRRGRAASVAAAVAVVLALGVRAYAAEAFRVVGPSMEPAVPAGAWVLVAKLAGADAGDLVVFRDDDGRNVVARVEAVEGAALRVAKLNRSDDRPGVWPRTIPRARVVGRVWLVGR